MTSPNKAEEFDWNVCTWKGSRRRQHEEFHALSFSRKLEVIEEMGSFVQNRHNSPQAVKSAVIREQPEKD